eukprot:TRINITY_DN40640_c0_g1_i1.p1 TRINITY_DN40640_c0_g1~~TRINITY_DN40640_c0_g1_i1.p1  ORF type:complete len:474 (+),score=133.41 TRINITY_DN40640_c0_g1_i1:64-1422(+)
MGPRVPGRVAAAAALAAAVAATGAAVVVAHGRAAGGAGHAAAPSRDVGIAGLAAPPQEPCSGGPDCWGPPPPDSPPGLLNASAASVRAFAVLSGPPAADSGSRGLYCLTLGSAALSGVPLTVLGWGGTGGSRAWRGAAGMRAMWQRLVLMSEAAEAAAAEAGRQLLLFVDGADVVITAASAAALAASFASWRRRSRGRRILVAGEHCCWVRTLPENGCRHDSFPWRQDGELYPYPNTGMLLGAAPDLAWLLRGVLRFAVGRYPDPAQRWEDQALVGEALATVPALSPTAPGGLVGVDSRAAISQQLWLDWELLHCDSTARGAPRLRNALTSSQPLVWHANGPKWLYDQAGGAGWLLSSLVRSAPWARRARALSTELTSSPQWNAAGTDCGAEWAAATTPPRKRDNKHYYLPGCESGPSAAPVRGGARPLRQWSLGRDKGGTLRRRVARNCPA